MGLQRSAAGVLGTVRHDWQRKANTSGCSRCWIGREVDIWRYIQREKIPIPKMYFARDGQRYRSLGCQPDHSSDQEQRYHD